VNYQLHSSALIEEAFGDDSGLRRHGSENRPSLDYVLDGLFRGGVIQSALVF
jgi:hypothetical protein